MSVIFPVRRTVNSYGRDYKKTLEKGDEVNCYFCHKRIAIGPETVYISDVDGMPIVKCPSPTCRRAIPALYYFDHVLNHAKPLTNKLKRKKVQAT